MNQSSINFLIKALGAEEAAKEIDKISKAAKKAGTSVKQYLSTASGSQRLLDVQTKAAIAQTEKQAAATEKTAAATRNAGRAQESYFGHIAKTTVQSALINKLFLEFIDVSDQAIKQVDLMNNFPTTMASMGQSAEVSGAAFQKLRDYVGQVGGNLGNAASMVTRFTGVTKDVQASVAIFAGLNNALVAGDSNLQEQAQAAVQFAQAFERGKPDMKEWLSLTQNMSQQLNMVAREMGYVNATALGESLRDGTENMGAFTAQLTEMSTGMGPIAQQALARMQGMQFAFNVMKNTMVQGLASIIDAFGRSNIVSFFAFWTQVVQVLTQAVVQLIGVFMGLINAVRGLFGMSPLEGLKKDAVEVKDATEGTGDALKGAKKDADKLNKALASFDKMNVLADKTSGKKDDDDAAKGGTTFDAAQMDALKGAFDGITGKLQEVSIWAKIFAGFLASIAAVKFAQGLMDQFNGLSKTLEDTGKNVDKLKKKLSGDEAEPNIFQRIANQAKNLPVIVGGSFSSMGKSVQKFGKFLLTPVGAIAAIAVAIGILYFTNEDFKKGFDKVWNPIIEVFNEAVRLVGGALVGAFEGLLGWLEKLGIPIGKIVPEFQKLADTEMEALGLALGGLAVIIGGVLTIKLLFAIAHFVVLGVQGAASAVAAGVAWVIQSGRILVAIVATVISSMVQFVMLGVAAVTPAVSAGAAWVAQMAAMLVAIISSTISGIAQFVALGLAALKSSLKASAAWIAQMARIVLAITVSVASGIAGFVSMGVTATIQAGIAGAAWMLQAARMVAAWAVAFVFYLTQTALAASRTLVAGAIMAVGWLIGLGPIGLIILAIAALIAIVAIVVMKFEDIKKTAEQVFKNVAKFAGDAWQNIKNTFANIGKTVGDAVGNAFKTAINGILGFLEGRMNDVVNIVNGAIGAIDAVTPGSLPRLGRVSLPRLARGGIVDQATIAMIGEEGKEAVVPLENNLEWIDKLAAKINTTNTGGQPVHLTIQIGEEKIATKVIDLINEQTQMSGRNKILV